MPTFRENCRTNDSSYVDKRNRRSQSRFTCLWCGHIESTSLNAAPDIGQRRALATGSVFQMKDAVLAKVVRAFGERRVRSMRLGITRKRGAPPILGRRTLTFGTVPLAVVRSSERREVPVKSGTTSALVAARANPIVPFGSHDTKNQAAFSRWRRHP